MSVAKLLPSKYGYSNAAIVDGRIAFISGQIAEDEHGALSAGVISKPKSGRSS
jgi:enamine deaminase RidA (YjgF/YER057c/UK114 family)